MQELVPKSQYFALAVTHKQLQENYYRNKIFAYCQYSQFLVFVFAWGNDL